MATDAEILKRALNFETLYAPRAWEKNDVGASMADINRLTEGEYVECRHHSSKLGIGQYGPALYKLTGKGRAIALTPDQPIKFVSAAEVIGAMSLIVGFDDLKDSISFAIEKRKRTHFLLEGPPACAKSVILDAVRRVVPDALLIFGSRTSGRGLSDTLFENRPSILLADETDKMRYDVFSMLLGIMESGELIETKSQNTRGIRLNTMVIAACNSSKKMPPEFKSRFALHARFPEYTREEFIAVVCSMLSRTEDCPEELAALIAAEIYGNKLGDVRQARGVWGLMKSATKEEAERVLRMKIKYSTGNKTKNSTGVLI